MYSQLTTEEKITKVKIQLQESHPFWAYLILRMNMEEDKRKVLPPYGGMGVDPKGHMIYNKEFVDKLSENELSFCLAHEVSHLIFEHLMRLGNKDMMLWNIATDTAVNYILEKNNFVPPKGILRTGGNGKITIFGTHISDLHKKSSEQIYDELGNNQALRKALSKMKGGYRIKIGEGGSQSEAKSFDEHKFGEGMSKKEMDDAKEKWKDGVIEASTHAKSRGLSPCGMDDIIGKILNPKLNWKQLVKRYIVSHLPVDFSFSRPNRKFRHVILPGVIKENIEMVVAIDTSGSVSKNDLRQFLGECMSIARSHKNLKMTLIQCDAEIHEVIEFNTYNAAKIANIVPKGRGGTSHEPIVNWMLENAPNCRLLIIFSDGYSDMETELPRLRCDKLIILNCDYAGLEKYGKVVNIGRI